ncbi:MAG: Mur ligase family protein [Granulosicoccaceae bacterium]
MDIRCTQAEANFIVPVWQAQIQKIIASLGWPNINTSKCQLVEGLSLSFSAPIDVLYAATEINEWVFACCEAHIDNTSPPDFDSQLEKIKHTIANEEDPQLLALERSAKEHQLTFLWDDDDVSLGLGRGSQTWSRSETPAADKLNWSLFEDIPVGIVTGTNGKTTTVRVIHHILKNAGISAGLSSTEWVAVNERIIDNGDWSGPGGARLVLRQPDIDVAILETARGGLLRRGLGITKASAALITNISEDHLGDFGSQNLNELLNIKWVVSHAVETDGVLILNADDALLVDKAAAFNGTIIWFSLNNQNPVVTHHISTGGTACVLCDGDLQWHRQGTIEVVCASAAVSITLGGAASHNVANTLAAIAMATQLGVSISDIRSGLLSMSTDNNPGRSNLFDINGVSVLVDYAHNPAGIQAISTLVHALPAKRRLLAFSQPGDRPASLIKEVARNVWSMGLDRAVVSELAHYHRGRAHGEVFELIKEELLLEGARTDQIDHFEEEMDSLQNLLECAQPGDLIIMLALSDSTTIQQRLRSLSS